MLHEILCKIKNTDGIYDPSIAIVLHLLYIYIRILAQFYYSGQLILLLLHLFVYSVI